MSADNCIAILKTTDKFQVMDVNYKKNMFGEGIIAYRVAHIQAHDNFDWYKENEVHNLGCWFALVFKHSTVFYDRVEAFNEAKTLQENVLVDYGILEYGIVELDASEYNFPGC